jgi:predicted dehydrogenase
VSPAVADPVRVGLIGCGDISPSHLRSYQALGMRLVAVADLDRARAERRRGEWQGPPPEVYVDHRELLARDDIDLVTVATPVSGHAPVTIAALRAGKHVACEKPSALSLAENVAIREAARAAGRRVAFCSGRLRYGAIELARQQVAAGRLGRIYRADVRFARRCGRPGIDIIPDARWFLDRQRAGGGVVMDMGQYFMDAVLHLLDWPRIDAVAATSFRGFPHRLPADVPFDVEEQMTLLVRAADGCTLTFDLSWIGHQRECMQASLRGLEGGVQVDWLAGDGQPPFAFFSAAAGPGQWLTTTSDWRDQANANDRFYGDLVRAMRGEAVEAGTTPDQAIVITRLTLMAQRSAELGREVRADEVPVPG